MKTSIEWSTDLKLRYYIILVLLTLNSCKSLDNTVIQNEELHDFIKAPLLGMIYQKDNQPCAGVDVKLYEIKDNENKDQKIIFETQTDISGRFVLPNVQKGFNKILFTKDGNEPSDIEFNFNAPSQILYLQMVSLEDLISMTEDAFDLRKWDAGHEYIQRALSINQDSFPAQLLQAVYLSTQGNIDQSNNILKDLGFIEETLEDDKEEILEEENEI
jgi:hypothetical protein